uniref:Flagellar hook protein FlgE n=1 Tax=Thermodesulfobacterium geofontis TaxID=1295609 RepID=A0A7V5XHH6_9BACT
MGIFGSIYTCYSGIFTSSIGMSVVGDNIANLNTIGFKGSRFELMNKIVNVLNETFLKERGSGVFVENIRTLYTQGGIITTYIPTDLAISGKGFFIVSDKNGNIFYTRDGQFFVNEVDENYFALQNSLGLYLLGADPTAETADLASLKPYLIPKIMPPKGTSEINLQVIFDSRKPTEEIDDPLWGNYNATQETPLSEGKYEFVWSLPIYDNLGGEIILKLYADRTSNPNEYEVLVALEDPTLDGRGEGIYQGAFLYGILTFGENGDITDAKFWEVTNPSSFNPNLDPPLDLTTLGKPQFNLNIQGNTQTITLDLGFKVEKDGNITRTPYASKLLANPFVQLYYNQNGYSQGIFDKIEVITEEGLIKAWYTNGQNSEVAKIFLADFTGYEDSLIKIGSNLFLAKEGATPFIFAPGFYESGRIISGALEGSNVDLAMEMINLIVLQRAFQSNLRAIVTADQLLEDFFNKV